MFEDIYKQQTNGIDTHSPIFFSTDFKEEYWEEIKKDPKKLGDLIKSVISMMVGIPVDYKPVFTDFQFIDGIKKLQFCFELYDMRDEYQRKIYLDKKKQVENMERLEELEEVKPGDKNDEVIPTMDND